MVTVRSQTWILQERKTSADQILGYVDPESDGSLEDDLAARRYRALLPEDDYDSDDY